MDEREQQLVVEIIEFLSEPKVRPAVQRALKKHGYEAVRQEFREMCTQVLTRASGPDPIKNPAGYFIQLLKRLDTDDSREFQAKLKSCFFETVDEHIGIMRITEISSQDVVEFRGAMDAPYGGQGMPWPTGLGPEFFTLSTNKAKSDFVQTQIRLANGETIQVPMIRGKSFANGEERGILTAEDNRIIKAMVIIWVEDGCQYTTGKVSWCFATFSVRRLARTMGYTNFGGRDLVRLARRLDRMGTISYYIDLSDVPGFAKFEKKTCSIDFIDKPQILDGVAAGKREIVFRVCFSEFLSQMFLRRKTVTRSKDLVLQKNELALLVQEYIESRVATEEEEKDGFRIALGTLIERLHLPAAKWHKYKSQRQNVFQKAVNEVNASTTWDGDTFFAYIDGNPGGVDSLLRVKRRKIIDAPELPFAENTYTPKARRYLIARERAQRAYVSTFQKAAIGNLALVLRGYLALRKATDPQ